MATLWGHLPESPPAEIIEPALRQIAAQAIAGAGGVAPDVFTGSPAWEAQRRVPQTWGDLLRLLLGGGMTGYIPPERLEQLRTPTGPSMIGRSPEEQAAIAAASVPAVPSRAMFGVEEGMAGLPTPTPTVPTPVTPPTAAPKPKTGERPLYGVVPPKAKEGAAYEALTGEAVPPAEPEEEEMPFALPPFPEGVDFESEMRRIAATAPRTPEEIAGPRPTIPRAPLPLELLRQFSYGMLYGGARGAEEHERRIQAVLDKQYDDKLQMAVAAASEERKAEYAILSNKVEQQKIAEEGYGKYLEHIGRVYPESFTTRPEVLGAAMRLWHMDEKAINEFLASRKRPDGTYDLGKSEVDRKVHAYKTQARAMKIMYPALSEEEIAEIVVTGGFIDHTKRFENRMMSDLAAAQQKGDMKEYNKLLDQFTAYKSAMQKSALRESMDKMTVLYQMKDVIVKNQGQDFFNWLSQSAYASLFGARVPHPSEIEKVTKEKEMTPTEKAKMQEMRLKYTGLPGILVLMYPEQATKEGGILFEQENARKVIDKYNMVKAEVQDMIQKGQTPEKAMKHINKQVSKEEQALLWKMADTTRIYMTSVDPLTGKLRTDPTGRPRSEILRHVMITPDNFLQIIELIDMGETNINIIRYFRTPPTK